MTRPGHDDADERTIGFEGPTPGAVGDHLERTIGGYRIVREIGRGAMGVVYEAEELELGRHVALKVLPELFSADPERLDQFDKEARALARVQHARIVQIHRVGRHADTPFLAMELVRGAPLSRHLDALATTPVAERGAADLTGGEACTSYEESAVRLVLQVLDGVAAIHAFGIVHRDLKPDNLLVTEHSEIKIADFGLAKDIVTSSGLTSLGRPRGTPLYMSPEQATGNLMGLDHRSDLFSVGVILYELLAGTRPFRGDTFQTVAKSITITRPDRLRKLNRRVSKDLDNVVERALEKDCEDRYETAQAFASDLERCLRGEPVVRGRPTLHDRVRRILAPQSPLAVYGALLVYVLFPLILLLVPLLQASRLARYENVLHVIAGIGLLGGCALLVSGLVQRSKPRLLPAILAVPALVMTGLVVVYSVIDSLSASEAEARLEAGFAKSRTGGVAGEHRAHLAALVGDFTAQMTVLPHMDGTAHETTGEATVRWTAGEACLVGEYTTTLFGAPAAGAFLLGYDDSRECYFAARVAGHEPGAAILEGLCEAGGSVITLRDARPEDAAEGLHYELTVRSEDELELVVVAPSEDGPYRSCQVLLTRR